MEKDRRDGRRYVHVANHVNKRGDILEFKCTIERELYNSDDFKIYAANVDTEEYPNVKLNEYGNATLVGNIHTLDEEVEYTVIADETKNKKFGTQYQIKNIRRDVPRTVEESHKFLKAVITENQAEALLKVYPDIVPKIINDDLDDVDFDKIYGIREKTFDKIKDKVNANFALVGMIEKYGGYGITIEMLKKLKDKYASVEKLEEELLSNPYKALCKVSGIGFKKADHIVLTIPPEMLNLDYNILISHQRMKECILYLMDQNESEGHTKIDLRELRKEAVELTPHCIDHFVDVLKDDKLFVINKTDATVAKKGTYDTEQFIAKAIVDLLGNKTKFNIDWTKYNEIDGHKLTDEQMGALKNLCECGVSLLSGLAGSGKSSTSEAIINMLDDNNISYKLLAPTGRAAQVLSKYTGRSASTIHRGLEYNPKKGWQRNSQNPLLEDVIIVDEASMVDIFVMRRLLTAIQRNKTKLLLIQDVAQIPSVSAGNIIHDIINTKKIPTTSLTKIFRYAEGGFYNVTTKVRHGKRYIDESFEGTKKAFGTKKDYVFVNVPAHNIVDGVVNLYESLIKKGNTIEEIMVVSHHNKGDFGTKAINSAIQNRINPPNGRNYLKHGETCFYEGDKVLQVVNNYEAKTSDKGITEVFNGNTGHVLKVYEESIEVFINGEHVIYPKDKLSQLNLGYAISIHRSQGGAAKNVIVVTPDAHMYFINRNLLYTAITRTKEQCYHFCTPKLVNIALKKSETIERKTNLRNMILKEYKERVMVGKS